jgi:hypothetical protein
MMRVPGGGQPLPAVPAQDVQRPADPGVAAGNAAPRGRTVTTPGIELTPMPRPEGQANAGNRPPRREGTLPRSGSVIAQPQAAGLPQVRVLERPGSVRAGPTLASPTAQPSQAALPYGRAELSAAGHARSLPEPPPASASERRAALQDALRGVNVPTAGAPPEQVKAWQNSAHNAAVAYGAAPGTLLDRTIPFLQAAGTVGAGALGGFGIPGRSTGMAMADVVVGAATGGAEWGIHVAPGAAEPPPPPGAEATSSHMSAGAAFGEAGTRLGRIGAEYVGGAVLGGLGNFVGQKYLAPAVNSLLPIAFKPIPAEVIVPDEMVDLMDISDPEPAEGQASARSGTKLRDDVSKAISSAKDIGSDVNVAFGQAAFIVPGAIRAAIPQDSTGAAGTALIGAAVTTAGGAALGVAMAANQMRAKVQVPNLSLLREDAAAARLPENMKQVPLFYSHHKETTLSADIKQGLGYASNTDMAQVLAYRMAHMAKASASLSVAQIPAAMVGMATTSAAVVNSVAAISGAAGTWVAMIPWFDSLGKRFPENDKAHKPAAAATPAQLSEVLVNNLAFEPQGPAEQPAFDPSAAGPSNRHAAVE